jgi:predicted helicase
MENMLPGDNLGLITVRKIPPGAKPNYFMVSSSLIVNGAIRSDNQSIDSLYPVYYYPTRERLLKEDRRPNLNPDFVRDVEKHLGLSFVSDGTGDLKKTFGPEDIFHYMYAVFHSPIYRSRYAEFLKIDFPRLPLTSDRSLFASLTERGRDLVALHLMESPLLDARITSYPVPGEHLVEKVRYVEKDKRVYINKEQYFEGVPQEAWEFRVGGYQVCDKWLKDRRGRNLSFDDLEHYQRIVVALQDTIRFMGEIDSLVPGWPIK